jgi:hypothetical protein
MASNKAIKFAPFGRRTLVPRAVYCGRYVGSAFGLKYFKNVVFPVAGNPA